MAKDGWDTLLEREYQALRHVTETMANTPTPEPTRPQNVAIMISLRTMSHYRSVKRMLSALDGMDVIRTVVRSCFDNLFVLAAIAKDGPAQLAEMERSEDSMNASFAEFLIKQKLYENAEEEVLWRNRAKAAKAASGGGRRRMPGELAKGTDAVDAYVPYMALSNDAVHVNVRSLARYWNKGQFVTEPEASEAEQSSTRCFLSMALLATMVSLGEVFDKSTDAEVKPLWDRHVDLAKQIVNPAEV